MLGAAVSSSFGGRGVPTSAALNLYRLSSTGENNPSFAKIDLNPSVPGLKDTFRALRILLDGRDIVEATSSGDPVRACFIIQLFTSSALVDPCFMPLDNSDAN